MLHALCRPVCHRRHDKYSITTRTRIHLHDAHFFSSKNKIYSVRSEKEREMKIKGEWGGESEWMMWRVTKTTVFTVCMANVGMWYLRSCSLYASVEQSKRYTLKLGAEFNSRTHRRQRRNKFEFQMQTEKWTRNKKKKEKHAREYMKIQ